MKQEWNWMLEEKSLSDLTKIDSCWDCKQPFWIKKGIAWVDLLCPYCGVMIFAGEEE